MPRVVITLQSGAIELDRIERSLLSGEMIMQFVGVQGFASLGLSVLFTPSLRHAQSQIFAYPGAG
jgi:hypothetical protein